MGARPMETIKQLWGGELPEFDSMEAVNELLNGLMEGLWNRLSAHQSSLNPFRPSALAWCRRERVLRISYRFAARNRRFVEGLFGSEEHMNCQNAP